MEVFIISSTVRGGKILISPTSRLKPRIGSAFTENGSAFYRNRVFL